MQLVRYSWLFFTTHLVRMLWTKRVILCAVLAAIPCAIAAIVSSLPKSPAREEVFMYPAWFLLLQVITPLLSLVMGSAVISEEIDDRTISFPFSRPAPRASLLIGRWAASALALVVLLGASASALAIISTSVGSAPASLLLTADLITPIIIASILGGLVYSALFATIGVFLRHPMIVGLAYCFVIEALAANLPGRTRSLAVQHYLRGYVAGGSDLWTQINEDLFKTYDSQSASLIGLTVILFAALGLGSWAISRKEYVLES
jgi:ABC-type transport system involved in multi-copper enzyme maturation permease subunit